jgi:hypothetical protein
MTKTTAPTTTPSASKRNAAETKQPKSPGTVFIGMALNMTWQLAIVVLVPIIAGAELDKALKTGSILLFVGFLVALIGTTWVLWLSLQRANNMPVPKLTAAEKKAIQKKYEEEDND